MSQRSTDTEGGEDELRRGCEETPSESCAEKLEPATDQEASQSSEMGHLPESVQGLQRLCGSSGADSIPTTESKPQVNNSSKSSQQNAPESGQIHSKEVQVEELKAGGADNSVIVSSIHFRAFHFTILNLSSFL